MKYDLPYNYANRISRRILSNGSNSYAFYNVIPYLGPLIEKYSDLPMQLFDLPDNVLGHTYKDSRGTTVFINSKITNPGRKWFTVAHELGHLLMHLNNGVNPLTYNSSIDSPKTVEEQEANWFAAHVLLPDSVIIKDIIDGFPVKKIMNTSFVSKEMIRYRILDIFHNVYYIPRNNVNEKILEMLIDDYFYRRSHTSDIQELILSLVKLPRKDLSLTKNAQNDYWLQFKKPNLEIWDGFSKSILR